MATAKTTKNVKPQMPKFTGKYTTARKMIWKATIGAPTPADGNYFVAGKFYKSEQGYRAALRKKYDESMRVIDRCESAVLPKKFEIDVHWSKGSMGANQARAELTWREPFYHYIVGEKTKGYGYDKETTAIADVLNKSAFGMKIALDLSRLSNPPYGINKSNLKYGYVPDWEGGVGMSSFINALKKAGYNYQHHGSDRYDYYVFTKGRKS